MDLNKILVEAIETRYPAVSQPPRYGFGPLSSQGGTSLNQSGLNSANKLALPENPAMMPPPLYPESLPWPLDTVNEDLADAFVFLYAAIKKIKMTFKDNPAITKEQQIHLISYYKILKKALKHIKDVGVQLTPDINIAEQPIDIR